MTTRRQILTGLLALPLCGAASVGDAGSVLFDTVSGVAIGGYDPVAYFSDGRALKGRPEHAVMWKRAIWRFATARHREIFEANPRGHAPQYGGFCAYGMSRGQLASIDPEAWDIVENRLYLKHSHAIRQFWLQDVPGNIRLADANWPALRGG